ncbi:MAG: AAA family ATPase [Rhodospirillales bacterium]|nr:AAA family ATPase [Rhodospirillales bacterium]
MVRKKSTPQSALQDGDEDELPLWARLDPFPRHSEEIENILGVLRNMSLTEELEPLRATALNGDVDRRQESARAALALARGLLSEEPDVIAADAAYSWVWLAAHRDSLAAALMMVDALIGRAKQIERKASPRDVAARRHIAALRTLACRWFDMRVSIWLSEAEIDNLPARLSEDLVQPAQHAGPARVVIENWPAQHRLTDLDMYKALAKPVPLRGGDRDLGEIVGQLHREFPWMGDAIDRIADDLALCGLGPQSWIRIRPLLLVGPPGSGKSRFARRLAEMIGTGCQLISASGSSDDRSLVGTAHAWGNREPGAVLQLMLASGAANPLIIVDEIEKAGGSPHNGDIRRSLLAMLEPETAKRWFDECLQAHCDLSGVSWVLTANCIEPISKPLLSRIAVARVGLPGPDAIDGIIDAMRVDIASELGLDIQVLPEIDPAARRALADAFNRGRSLRAVKAALTRAMAATARQVPRVS